jgi:hypothetical protein
MVIVINKKCTFMSKNETYTSDNDWTIWQVWPNCTILNEFFVNAKELGPCKLKLCKQEGSKTEVSILSKQEKNMLEVNKLGLCTPEPCICRCGIRQSHLRWGKCIRSCIRSLDCHKPPPRRQPRSKGRSSSSPSSASSRKKFWKNKNNKWKIKFM